jgi:hypothetical protein
VKKGRGVSWRQAGAAGDGETAAGGAVVPADWASRWAGTANRRAGKANRCAGAGKAGRVDPRAARAAVWPPG